MVGLVIRYTSKHDSKGKVHIGLPTNSGYDCSALPDNVWLDVPNCLNNSYTTHQYTYNSPLTFEGEPEWEEKVIQNVYVIVL